MKNKFIAYMFVGGLLMGTSCSDFLDTMPDNRVEVNMAVGVIIGAAFGKIVSSLVADIIMPPLGLLIGGIDFKQFAVTLRDAQGDIPAVVMHYGVFIQNVFDFLIVAFAIFMAIKLINKLNRKKEEPAAAPAPTKEEVNNIILIYGLCDMVNRAMTLVKYFTPNFGTEYYDVLYGCFCRHRKMTDMEIMLELGMSRASFYRKKKAALRHLGYYFGKS